MTFSRTILCAASLLAFGACGKPSENTEPEKEKTQGQPKAQTAHTAGQSGDAKINPTPVATAPLPVRPLPKDSGTHRGDLVFAKSYGGKGTDSARSIGIDSAGDIVMCGYFTGANSQLFGKSAFVSKDSGGFLAKVSGKDGSHIWSVPMGSDGPDTADALVVGKDDSIVVAGSMSGTFVVGDGAFESAGADDVFVAKFASDGHRLWAKRMGGAHVDAADSVTLDAAGNVYVLGGFHQEVKFGDEKLESAGHTDIFLSKLSAAGEFLWTKRFGAFGEDYGRDILFDSTGHLILLAEISQQVDFGGGPLTTKGNRDMVLAKFDSDGRHIWSKSMGSDFDDVVIELAIDPADNIIFTGTFEDELPLQTGKTAAAKAKGLTDVYVAKFDTNGELLWTRAFGGKDKDWGSNISSDGFGNLYLIGWFGNEISFDDIKLRSKGLQDIFVLKMSAAGKILWAKSFGNKRLDMGMALAVDAVGGIVMTAVYNDQIQFGNETFTPVPGDSPKVAKGDLVVAKFEP